MRKLIACFLLLAILNVKSARADEGMWLLPLIEKLNISTMNEMGFQLTAEDIYSINRASIKDAVVIFDGGCTGEIVSDNGLLFTNHHCGFDYIQDLSSVENNYLDDGFWAKSQQEELLCPGLEVSFLERIDNVTDTILSVVSDTSLSKEEIRSGIKECIASIEEKASENGTFHAEVLPFFAGNEYYLFIYRVYKDVRLVGTPPSSIGKFGYETDNWEWPRHTGDFSIFRVYTAPDGSPAEYSSENIPLKPKYFLPISLAGIKDGDLTITLGYPGGTYRYMSSSGIREIQDIKNQNRITVRTVKQDILKKDMNTDPKINIQYAAKFTNSSNFWKYSIGQNRQLDVLNVIERKEAEEKAFREWANADSARKLNYGNILDEMDDCYRDKKDNEMNFSALFETFFAGTELIGFVMNFKILTMHLQLGDTESEEMLEQIADLKKQAKKFFKDYNLQTDMKVAKAMFSLYQEMIPANQQPDIYSTVIDRKYRGNIDKFIDKLYSKTFFIDEKKTMEFLDNPSLPKLQRDPGFIVTNSIFRKYYEEYIKLDAYEQELNELERLYMKARMEMYNDSCFYPDANFTMRLSYGKVAAYSPSDAVHYDEITTLKGVMQKEDRTNYEFLVPDKLKKLYTTKDYGRYGVDGIMPVNFITDNDITGGSSGSPVLNAKGELIGLAFDGNWEAMASDISFEPEIQRCICVDIRYVLFIIDKFADNSYLINELRILQ